MPKLNEILGEEAYKAVPDGVKNKYKDTDFVNSAEYVPKDRFKQVTDEKNEYKKQVEERDNQLNDLQGKVKDNETLTNEIKTLKQTNKQVTDDYESKLSKIKLDTAVKEALKQSKVKDIDLAMKLINYDNLKLSDDGSVVGINEQIEPMKKEREYLFEKDAPGGTGHFQTGGKDNPPVITPLGERLGKQKAASLVNTEEQNKFFK